MDPLSAGISVVVVFLGLLLPGYAMTYLVFPRREDLDVLERIALSFALSLVVIPSVMLFENKILHIPINPVTVALNLVGLVIFSFAYRELIWPRMST